MSDMVVVDVYLRIRPKDGRPWVSHHRAWDSRRFVEHTTDAYAKDERNPANVDRIDEATYRKERVR